VEKKDLPFCLLLLFVGALVAGFIGYTRDSADNRVTAVQRDLDAANESIARLQSELDTANGTLAELDALDERIEPELDALGRRFGDVVSTARNLDTAAQSARDSYYEVGRLLQSATDIAQQYEAFVRQYAGIRGPGDGAATDSE
jgi:chromosome segregation ATPase